MSDSCKTKSRVVIRYEFTCHHSLVQYLIDIPLGMAAAGPPAKRYQSAFKAPQLHSEFSSALALMFDSYQFMQTFCTVNGEGGIMLIKKSKSGTILVVKGWQKFAQSSKPIEAGVSTQGYLSQGYSKFAFQVSSVTLSPYTSADGDIATGCSWIHTPCNISGEAFRDL